MSNVKYIGIIGWNDYSKTLANMYHFETRDTEVLAIATQNIEGQTFAREKLGLKHIFNEPHSLYELHQLDMICIQSSPDHHLAEIQKSLAAGVKIMIDQPLAGNVQDCLAIEKATKSRSSQKSLLLMPRRFDPQLRHIKKIVTEGAVGEIISISLTNHETYRKNKGNLVNLGIFMDITYQDIDTIRWITGQEFKSVYAIGSANQFPELTKQNDADTVHISCKLSDGTLASLHSFRTYEKSNNFELKIKGTKGELQYSSLNYSTKLKTKNTVSKVEMYEEDENYIRALKYMGANLSNSNRLPYDISIGTIATKVAVAMTKSFVLNQIEELN